MSKLYKITLKLFTSGTESRRPTRGWTRGTGSRMGSRFVDKFRKFHLGKFVLDSSSCEFQTIPENLKLILENHIYIYIYTSKSRGQFKY